MILLVVTREARGSSGWQPPTPIPKSSPSPQDNIKAPINNNNNNYNNNDNKSNDHNDNGDDDAAAMMSM